MPIFAIADLHLSFNKPVSLFGIDSERDQYKPMDVFGWERHFDRIREHWMTHITQDDTVLIPGDISWALDIEAVKHDFHWIAQLPGRKVLSPGNHCYYAKSKKKVREALPEGMTWLDGDHTVVAEYAVVATRGWMLPGDPAWQEEKDRKIYDRQVGRLRIGLEAAKSECPEKPVIVMLHYPPITSQVRQSEFFDVLTEYEVDMCVYGHLHGDAHRLAVNERVDGVALQLVSCDFLSFRPQLIR